MTQPADPFEVLAAPVEPVEPRPDFARDLRARLAAALERGPDVADVPTIDLPERSGTMSATTTPTTTPTTTQTATPYLAVHDGAAALRFYEDALGASVTMRMVGDDGRIGHAEFQIGSAHFYLADEYPDIGVVGPRTLGGTTVTLHLDVEDVDRTFARAVDAGATSLGDPADQPHGARHGTLVDPFGHRWMLSQQIEELSIDELDSRMGAAGYAVEASEATETGAPGSGATGGGIWSAINARDARAMIRFIVDVLGFEEQLVVPDEDPAVIVHSQLTWPEGGVVQVGTADRPGNVFSERPVGGGSLYVITTDPDAVYRRCVEAGVEILAEPASPDYDPGGMVFSIRDHEGNLWSFGTYAGE